MRSPHFLSTDGQLFRLTLQGTLVPATEKAVAEHAAEMKALSELMAPMGDEAAAGRHSLREVG